MKISKAFVEKLIRLCRGESLPYSSLNPAWVKEMLDEGLLVNRSLGGLKKRIQVRDVDAFRSYLSMLNEGLADLDSMLDLLSDDSVDATRAKQAMATGNSKLKHVRSFPGFLVNSFEPIRCSIGGEAFDVMPIEGSGVFVFDWPTFAIPADVVIVGIENPENFRRIREQKQLLRSILGEQRILFVSRYPQSTDLRNWLLKVRNRYVHFGDFDLGGIHIFLSEFHQFLRDRASYLIPHDVESRIKKGSAQRFIDQYDTYKNLKSDIPEIKQLIEWIMKYHRCYDQEGYIGWKKM